MILKPILHFRDQKIQFLYMEINFSLDVDDCEPNPCKHGGSCYDGIDRHSCVCVLGYAGYNCEIGSQWFILIIFYSKLFDC